jgi:hypothetical protein
MSARAASVAWRPRAPRHIARGRGALIGSKAVATHFRSISKTCLNMTCCSSSQDSDNSVRHTRSGHSCVLAVVDVRLVGGSAA